MEKFKPAGSSISSTMRATIEYDVDRLESRVQFNALLLALVALRCVARVPVS